MKFDLQKSVALLKRTPEVFEALFSGVEHDWHLINEGANTWGGYNIIGHLIHGEKTDWIPRAEIILGNGDDKTFEPYDRFAQDRLYTSQTMDELLSEFRTLRTGNIQKLVSWNLTDEDLNKEGRHPDLGVVTLRQLIATWTVHDMAHLNQVSRVMVKHYADEVGPWKNYIKLLGG